MNTNLLNRILYILGVAMIFLSFLAYRIDSTVFEESVIGMLLGVFLVINTPREG